MPPTWGDGEVGLCRSPSTSTSVVSRVLDTHPPTVPTGTQSQQSPEGQSGTLDCWQFGAKEMVRLDLSWPPLTSKEKNVPLTSAAGCFPST